MLSVALALSAASLCVGSARASDSAEALAPWTQGQKPPFTLEDFNKQAMPLTAQPGQFVLVHFFATWCEPCRDELLSLRRLVGRTDAAKLHVIAISVAEVDMRVRDFVGRNPVNFPILLDRDRAVARSWDVSTLPTSFILDPDLKPRLFIERDYDWDKFDVRALRASSALRVPPMARDSARSVHLKFTNLGEANGNASP